MKIQSFEEFLKELHSELHPEILDDDLFDAYGDWLGELDGEDYIEYAELYGKQRYLDGKGAILEPLKK